MVQFSRQPPRPAGAVAVAAVLLWAVATIGCSTVHQSSETDVTWETPRGFERVDTDEDDDEDGELLFVVEDPGRAVAATLRRSPPAYPDPVLPHVVAARIGGQLDTETDVQRTSEPAGWSATLTDDDGWRAVYAVPTDEATLWLVATAPEQPDDPDLLQTLAAGFGPAVEPNLDDELPAFALDDGLDDSETIELRPPASDGTPRSGLMRPVAFPTLATGGHLLAEPLTRPVDADGYADRLLERVDAVDPTRIELDECVDACGAYRWRTAGEPSEIHRMAFVVDDDHAYQLRLQAPESAADLLEDHHRQWLADFVEQPADFFDESLPR